jgi:Tfp pilus assembly protein PilF
MTPEQEKAAQEYREARAAAEPTKAEVMNNVGRLLSYAGPHKRPEQPIGGIPWTRFPEFHKNPCSR